MALGASAPSAAKISEKAIAGHSGELKEYVIGVQVFGKEASFDPRMDRIVRVQARRLRLRLVRYYRDEGHGDEIGASWARAKSPLFSLSSHK